MLANKIPTCGVVTSWEFYHDTDLDRRVYIIQLAVFIQAGEVENGTAQISNAPLLASPTSDFEGLQITERKRGT
jgi:hypothetical protein